MDRDIRRASGLVQTANKNSQNEDPNGSRGMRDEILIQRIRGGETDLFQELIHPVRAARHRRAQHARNRRNTGAHYTDGQGPVTSSSSAIAGGTQPGLVIRSS